VAYLNRGNELLPIKGFLQFSELVRVWLSLREPPVSLRKGQLWLPNKLHMRI
jgi:hypothetical protein